MKNSDVTAVILSASLQRARRSIDGVRVLTHVGRFGDAAGLLDARLAALQRVDTEWFFFLDDDDELPPDYLRVLDLCKTAGTPIAYTDEKIAHESGGFIVRKSSDYSADKFIANRMLIHHLAVCRTEAALRASSVIPRGTYAVENLLFFEVAKGGATYIPEVGYIWHRRNTGLSRHPSILIGMIQSATWAHRNRT